MLPTLCNPPVGEAEEWIEPYVKAGCKTTRVIVAKTEKELFCSELANEESVVLLVQDFNVDNTLLQNTISLLSEKSVVMMPHIYKNNVNKRLWRFIVNDTKGQECFDLYYCGMAFLDQKRHPHYYKINF